MCTAAKEAGKRMVENGEKESKQEVLKRAETGSEGGGGWSRIQSLLRLQNQTQADLTKTHFTVQRCANLQRK